MAGFFDEDMPMDIWAYHRRSKHALNRYALGPAMLDWANQPDPFRHFSDTRQILLPLAPADFPPSFSDLGSVPAQPLGEDGLGVFLELALGLSAWKEAGDARWALRNNPSSGNLHPTEGWLVLPPLPNLNTQPTLYHYSPLTHALEERCRYPAGSPVVSGGFLMALSSIPWREAWKYGERAFRYCQHDVGHAIAGIAYAAACLGWKVRVMTTPSDADLTALLGLNRPDAAFRFEAEHADLALLVGPDPQAADLPDPLTGLWFGTANRLSSDHDSWPVIDRALGHSAKPQTAPLGPLPVFSAPVLPAPDFPAAQVIRTRRSAQRMDGQTGLSRHAFFRMMSRVLPDPASVPWSGMAWAARLHLFVFVHRVEGLPPGLYALVRDPAQLDRLRQACHPDFLWEQPADCPLPLYVLQVGDFTRAASRVSCQQAIAGWGAFSLGMVADFQRTLEEEGPWAYRRLFWEAGMIGQVLYLEATLQGMTGDGIQGTGIGCYYDDDFHQMLGFDPQSLAWQSLYHFTVGGAVQDTRLSTLPAYGALRSLA